MSASTLPLRVPLALSTPIPPSAPTLSVSSTQKTAEGQTDVNLSWSAAGGADSYRLYRSTDGTNFSLLTTVVTSTYTDSVADGTYYWKVSGFNAGGEGPLSTMVSATLDATSPGAVTSLTAAQLTDGSDKVLLSWTAATGSPSGYNVLVDNVQVATNQASTTFTTAALTTGSHTFIVRALDTAGNVSADASTTLTVDAAPPGVPTGVTAVQTTTADAKVVVSWTASTGSPADYTVLVDGSAAASGITGTTYTTAAQTAGTHSYTVKARDSFGNLSAASTGATVTVVTAAPSSATGLGRGSTKTAEGVSTVDLTWTASASSNIARYEVQRSVTSGSGFVTVGQTTGTTYSDPGLADGTWYYRILTFNTGGYSANTAQTAITLDATAPSVPTGVTAVQTAAGDAKVVVSWTASTGSPDSYTVRADGATIGTAFTTTFTTAAQTAGSHTYTVRAVDAAGNASAVSTGATVTVVTTAPAAVTGLAIASTVTGSGLSTVNLSWTPSAGAASYPVQRSTSPSTGYTQLGAPTTTSYANTSVADGTWYYRVYATNAQGYQSTVAQISITLDATAPGAVTGLSAAQLTDGSDKVTLTWTAATGSPSGYNVLVDNVQVATNQAATTFTTAALADGSHTFIVRALDAAGNVSGDATTSLSVDATPPSVPTGVTASQLTDGSGKVLVSWTASTGTPVGYQVLVDGAADGTSATTSYTLTAQAEGLRSYTVKAYDSFGNYSGNSTPAALTVDRTAPSVPTGMTLSQLTDGSGRVSVSWTASTGSPTRYYLYVDGAPYTNQAGTSYTTNGLSGGSHAFTLAAQDAVGNRSAFTSAVNFTVDTTAPSIPISVSATQRTDGTDRVNLTWAASTGSPTGYNVLVDNVQVATNQAATSFTTAPLSDGAHTFIVRSVDAVGNVSDDGSASLTVDATAPAVPTNVVATQNATGTGSVTLTWNAVTVGTGGGYNIYVDGTLQTSQATTTYTTTYSAGSHSFTVRSYDQYGNTSASSTASVITVVTTAPSVPAGSAAQLTDGTGKVLLTWTASTGNPTSYLVFVDGVQVGTTASTTYTTAALAEGSHTFGVAAKDAYSNQSATGSFGTVAVDRTAPSAPTNLTVTQNLNSMVLNWTASPSSDVNRYRIYRAGTAIILLGNVTTYTNTGLADGSYSYQITALDAAGNESVKSSQASGTVDTTPPVAVSGVTAAQLTDGSGRVRVSWTAVSDAHHYIMYRDGSSIDTNVTSIPFTTLSREQGGSHDYTLRAVDASGNVSTTSSPPATVVVDNTAPTNPTVGSASASGSTVTATWNASASSDVASYRIYRDGVQVGQTTGLVFSESQPDGTYVYRLTAVDVVGNENAGRVLGTVLVDTVPPTVPVISLTQPTVVQVKLSWSANSDAAKFKVYQGSTSTVLVQPTAAEWTSGNLADGTYTYTVTSVDATGNESARSNLVTVEIDTTPPAAPTLTVPTVNGQQISLSWNAPATAASYVVFRDGTQVGAPTSTSYTDTVSQPGSYTYTVKALDSFNNASTASNSRVVNTVPPVPSGLAVTKTNGNQVGLTWTAVSTATSYGIYRNNVNVANVASNSFTETMGDGSYTYAVTAKNAGGESAKSGSVAVTVDTVPPSTPANLMAVAIGSETTLVWDSVSDAVKYNLHRDGALIASPTAATYTETLADGDYLYTVSAVDYYDNESADSSSVSVTVDTVPPAIPQAVVTVTGSLVEISWGSVPTSAHYKVFRDGLLIRTTATTSYSETLADGTYTYRVSATDQTGNESARSSSANAIVDTTAPVVPTVTQTHMGRAFTVTWDHIPDAVLFAIRLNGVSVGSTTDDHYEGVVDSDGTWSYQIAAKDTAGNWSAYSPYDPIDVDTNPPGAPRLRSDAGIYRGLLVWQPVPDSDVTGYEISRDGVVIGSTTASVTVYEDTVTNPGAYVYQVRAKDNAGNYSAWSAPVRQAIDRWTAISRPTLQRAPLTSSNPLIPATSLGRGPFNEKRPIRDYDPTV